MKPFRLYVVTDYAIPILCIIYFNLKQKLYINQIVSTNIYSAQSQIRMANISTLRLLPEFIAKVK